MEIDPQKLFFIEITNFFFVHQFQILIYVFGSVDYIFIFFKPLRGINMEVILMGGQYVLAYELYKLKTFLFITFLGTLTYREISFNYFKI